MRTRSRVDRGGRGLGRMAFGTQCSIVGGLILLIVSTGRAFAGAPGPEPEQPEPSTARPTRVMSATPLPNTPKRSAPRPVLDPSARLLGGDDASEAWTLFIQLDSGHRITQRFLLANAGPGEHNGVAMGHLVEPGRAPYRYVNGRRRSSWKLSEDRLFFDIGASHLDLHRPNAELRITKDDIEIRLFFDFDAQDPSARVPDSHLPTGYQVEVLAIGAATRGSVLAPWMAEPIETQGHAWLVHTWTNADEADLVTRRVEIFARDADSAFYGIHLQGRNDSESAWTLGTDRNRRIVESGINVPARWVESPRVDRSGDYPTPDGFATRGNSISGPMTLGPDWLRFDPLDVIPQPFRWFIRRTSKPQEVWADARIGVRILSTPDPPSLPVAGKTLSVQTTEASRSNREFKDETAERTVTGVASITFLNPMRHR